MDDLRLNLPATAMHQRGRKTNPTPYHTTLPHVDDPEAMILVIDSLNIFRSAAKCLCQKSMGSLLQAGDTLDFKSFCLFLSLYIPAIIKNHYDEARKYGDKQQLILDMVMKPSNWKRDYNESPCYGDNITQDGDHQRISKDENNMWEISCDKNYLRCVVDIVKENIEKFEFITGEMKPIVRYSIAMPEQHLEVQYRGNDDHIQTRKIKEINGIDDLLSIKKVFSYRQVYPRATIRLVTCDNQKSNGIGTTYVKQDGTIGVKLQRPEEHIVGDYLQHTVTLNIKSPPVDIAEVYIGENTSVYSHSALDFWDEINDTSMGGVLYSPFQNWNPPTVKILQCLYDLDTCQHVYIRRKNALSGHKCKDEEARFFFLKNQIILDVSKSRQLTYDHTVYDNAILSKPTDMIIMRMCVQSFQNKVCDESTMREFKNILGNYLKQYVS